MVRQRRGGRAGAGDEPAITTTTTTTAAAAAAAAAAEPEHHDAAAAADSSSSNSSRRRDKGVEEDGMPDAELRVGGSPLRGPSWSGRTQWMMLAIASGACAAFNGVFAKLTTTGLTSSIASSIASSLGLSSAENVVEVTVRGIFFALNLTFNGVVSSNTYPPLPTPLRRHLSRLAIFIRCVWCCWLARKVSQLTQEPFLLTQMWTLFTAALAKGTSTTQVSIINTSTNFVLTALLGLAIFSEALPPLWWAGAAMLVAGNVIVGRKDESKSREGRHPPGGAADSAYSDGDVDVDASAVPAAGLVEAEALLRGEEEGVSAKEPVDEDMIDLGDLSTEADRR
ncbi:hypothetical protein JDV02_007923 [Purpureocillium takamizusanense]|uniref:EamA domain-containing protein n=1 Tax=Purpureocillium takamizusanense TaxID=2060973 RepID=A0A9Q8QNH0_9HYPO|nr:uncharacterized protein JDV02_007923 [Purpureocillium takamizusanense]UNI21991.1 hypothetical protein JDV02_007923 [Purpureocillium takamizusanense]